MVHEACNRISAQMYTNLFAQNRAKTRTDEKHTHVALVKHSVHTILCSTNIQITHR